MSANGSLTELRLDNGLQSVPRARQWVAENLHRANHDTVVDDAKLIVGELVTNALLYVGPPVVVRLQTQPAQVRVEVDDASRIPPQRGRLSTDSMTGRGLALIERLATRWGVEPSSAGKTVWAELPTSPGPVTQAPPADAGIDDILAAWPDLDESAGPTRFSVHLGDVPTDLLLAAKRHVDNLVREFMLATGGAETGSTPAVPKDLARLITSVTTEFAEARQAIKRQALAAAAAGQERTRLELSLSVDAADAGERYLAALNEADNYARAARLLTMETPPQHRAFRTWYVTSLVEQLRDRANGMTPRPAPTLEQYLLSALDEVIAAQRIADRAARLQKVTAALASATTPDEVADVVVSVGVLSLGASGGSLLVPLDEEHLAVPGAVGYPQTLVAQLRAERRDAPLPAADALRTGRGVWLESRAESAERYPELTSFEPTTQSLCALPLVIGGRVLGALRFSFDRPRLFGDDERAFAEALAAQTAGALERARLFAVEREARARTAFLAEATQLLTSSLEGARTFAHLARLLVPAFADWVIVYLFEEGSPRAVASAHREPELADQLQGDFAQAWVDPATRGGLAPMFATPRTIRYDAVPDNLRQAVLRHLAESVPRGMVEPRAALGVPLIYRQRLVGAVCLVRTTDRPYAEDEQAVIEDVAARAAVAVVNAQEFERERETALTLQDSLLPQRLPTVEGIEVAWRYLPAGPGTLIGGDWYDVLPLDDGRVALVIGDVMGRGLQAAAIMGQLRATARAYAAAHMAPSEILAQLDAAVARLEQGQITTAAFAILDPKSRALTVAAAGHLPALIVPRTGDPRFLTVEPGPPLGVGEPNYPEGTLVLEPGAQVLLYTDGLVEDRTRSVEEGMELLQQATAGTRTPDELCDRALAGLGRTNSHDDDVALLAVSLRDPR